MRPSAAQGVYFLRWRTGPSLLLCTLIVAAPFAIFLPATVQRRVFYYHDLQYYFLPYHSVATEAISRGDLPLWNQYAFSGMPLIGDGQAAILYPLSWLYVVLPAYAATTYLILAQFAIAGSGQFALARCWGLCRPSSTIAAIVYMFSGFMTARVVHPSIQGGAAFLPWVLAGVSCTVRAPHSRRAVCGSAVAIALQVLAGHPQVPVYTALAVILYIAVAWIVLPGGPRIPLRRVLCSTLFAYCLALGLVAIQILPWAELATRSPRAAGAGFDFVFSGSATGRDWLLFLFPYLFGAVGSGAFGPCPDLSSAVSIWEHSAYVGFLPLSLAAYAVVGLASGPSPGSGEAPADHLGAAVRGRSELVVFCLTILVMGLILAAGRRTIVARCVYLVPLLGSLRNPERSLVLVVAALSSLAAMGVERLLGVDRSSASREADRLVICGWIPLLIVAAVIVGEFIRTTRTSGSARAAFATVGVRMIVPLVLSGASVLVLYLWKCHRVKRRIVAVFCLVTADMVIFAALFNPLLPPEVLSRKPAVLDFLGRDGMHFRKATFLRSNDLATVVAIENLAVSWGMAHGVEDVNGFNSLQSRRYTDYLYGPNVSDVSYGLLSDERLLRSESPILSSLNVKYLLVPSFEQPTLGAAYREVYCNAYVRVYENTLVYPRAFLVDDVVVEQSSAAVLAAVTADGFDGRRQAFVEGSNFPGMPKSDRDDAARATITQYSGGRIEVQTQSAQRRLLVLSDMYYPGWHATVDGLPVAIYRTNYLFRGIVIGPGRHLVVLRYRPASLAIGAGLTGISIGLMTWLLIAKSSKGRLRR